MFKHTPALTVFFSVAAFATTASAQLVVEANPDPDPSLCSQGQFERCLDGVGGVATSLDSLRISGERVSTRSRAGAGDEKVASLGGNGVSGMAAGAGALSGWSVWGSVSRSDYESTVSPTPYDGDSYALLAGMDRSFGERFIAGLAIGYENSDNTTFYNGGSQDRDGFTVAPYALYLINENLSVDVSVGYTSLDTDENRLDPTNGARLTGAYDADRFFGTANLNLVYPMGNLVLGGRLGVLYAEESQDGYTEAGGPSAQVVGERDIDLTQGYIGFDVGYSFGSVEPYALAMYRKDLSRDSGSAAGAPGGGGPGGPGGPGPGVATGSRDRDEFQLGLGVRFFGDNVSGSLEWLTTQGRSNFDDNTFTGTLRFDL